MQRKECSIKNSTLQIHTFNTFITKFQTAPPPFFQGLSRHHAYSRQAPGDVSGYRGGVLGLTCSCVGGGRVPGVGSDEEGLDEGAQGVDDVPEHLGGVGLHVVRLAEGPGDDTHNVQHYSHLLSLSKVIQLTVSSLFSLYAQYIYKKNKGKDI